MKLSPTSDLQDEPPASFARLGQGDRAPKTPRCPHRPGTKSGTGTDSASWSCPRAGSWHDPTTPVTVGGALFSAMRRSTATPRTSAATVYRQATRAACRSYSLAPLASRPTAFSWKEKDAGTLRSSAVSPPVCRWRKPHRHSPPRIQTSVRDAPNQYRARDRSEPWAVSGNSPSVRWRGSERARWTLARHHRGPGPSPLGPAVRAGQLPTGHAPGQHSPCGPGACIRLSSPRPSPPGRDDTPGLRRPLPVVMR